MANPNVALYGATPLDLATQEILNRPRGDETFEDALRSALLSWRSYAVSEARKQMSGLEVVDPMTINKVMDTLWQVFMPKFGQIVGPQTLRAYRRGFDNAQAGNVAPEVLDELAMDYVRRVGTYFHESSKESLVQGFSTYANRQMGTKAALNRALQGYGLSPRQTAGVANIQEAKLASGVVQSIRSKTYSYITQALRQRVDTIVGQEDHNLRHQADQAAWLWLVEHGDISDEAEKVWLTARDEKVCVICGPLHGVHVPVMEKFSTGDGSLWVPGAHPNCRCRVRLVTPLSGLVSKADDFDPDEHPRDGRNGRFTARSRAADTLRQRAQDRRTTFRPLGFADRPEGNVIEPAVDEPVETVEEVIETAPAKMDFDTPTKLDLGPTRLDLNAPTRMDFSAPQKMSFDAPEATGEKADLGAPAKAEFARVKTFTPSDEQRKVVLADFEEAVRKLDLSKPLLTSLPPRPTGREVMYSPTVPLEDPVYAVMPGWSVDNFGQIDLDTDIEFARDQSDVAMAASDMFTENIDAVASDIGYHQGNRIEKELPNGGGRLYAEINSEDVYEVVANTANDLSDEDWNRVATVRVEWRDSETDKLEYEDRLTQREIADEWGLDPNDFKISILRVGRGHDSSLGTTEYHPGSHYGEESWQFSGKFNAMKHGVSQVGYTPPIQMWDLEPDVEIYPLGQPGRATRFGQSE